MPFAEETEAPPRARGTIAWALRTAAVASLIGVAAAHYLARTIAPGPDPVRLATARPADPETTGSIAGGLRSVRLDPCTAPSGPRPGRP